LHLRGCEALGVTRGAEAVDVLAGRFAAELDALTAAGTV